jgi:hypothetical protein
LRSPRTSIPSSTYRGPNAVSAATGAAADTRAATTRSHFEPPVIPPRLAARDACVDKRGVAPADYEIAGALS